MFSLTCQGVQGIVYLQSTNAARGSVLSEMNHVARHVPVFETVQDEAVRRVTIMQSYMAARKAELKMVHWATKQLWAKHEVLLGQMRSATCKISCLESDISQAREM